MDKVSNPNMQIGFNPQELTEYQNVFRAIDKDKSGYIDKAEMKSGTFLLIKLFMH